MGLINYIKDSKAELKHVSWPSKRQTIIYTSLVIIISILTGIYLGFFDSFFAKVLDFLFIK